MTIIVIQFNMLLGIKIHFGPFSERILKVAERYNYDSFEIDTFDWCNMFLRTTS